MKVREILALFDSLHPNAFTDSDKIYFLNQVERNIFREIAERAEKPVSEPMKIRMEEIKEMGAEGEIPLIPLTKARKAWVFRPFTEGDGERELFSEETDIYIYYLMAMVDFHMGDAMKYNDDMAMFQGAWERFAAQFLRRNYPKEVKALSGILDVHRPWNK